jgi:uncharacterized protein (TIGR04222 family)
MTFIAATGDTWGLSGPGFLQLYAILGVAALITALIWRRRATAGRNPGEYRQLEPVELAYLNGGATLAIQTSLAGLHCAEAVDSGPTAGTVVASGAMPAGFEDVGYALHSALATPRTVVGLSSVSGVRDALRRLTDRLTTDGLLLSPAQRRAARAAALPVFALAGLGVVRLFAGVANHKPVGLLVLAVLVTLAVAAGLCVVPRVSAAGRAQLSRLRSTNAHLAPKLAPSWATYGAGGAMLGVALFGTQSLWAADPRFANQAGIPQAMSAGSSSSGGDSGGSGCGGSSCGGGGGCGGGGCGG